jgi:alginate O-acetyltransferase complex protein AlgI
MLPGGGALLVLRYKESATTASLAYPERWRRAPDEVAAQSFGTMLFNSAQFLFVFLPVVVIGFFLLGRYTSPLLAASWLVGASLVFYSWDKPWRLAPLILTSALVNYCFGIQINRRRSRLLLTLAIAFNLGLLAYFKYAAFITENLAAIGLPISVLHVVLPIGISFYTFTQLAFLVDTYRGEAREYSIVHYLLFVTYYPHLVAGPILHHKEIMPQFDRAETYRLNPRQFILGLSLFGAGLFKKVMLADTIGRHADLIFQAAGKGVALSVSEAWSGALSYTLQLYFDYSGYSDMAIGLAGMMGVAFPLNFFSPYKATSLIEFWRLWNMTLSRFLRDYLYVPLGGNRKGPVRRYVNLLVTMLIGGLWHGASWNFVLWGGIHGAALTLNHLWKGLTEKLGFSTPAVCGRILTLLVVIFAWVPFRAPTLSASLSIWHDMITTVAPSTTDITSQWNWIMVACLSGVALFMPNTAQIFLQLDKTRYATSRLRWQPNLAWAAVIGVATGVAIAFSIVHPTAFLYYRF